ncbi:MAG: dATP/dGTP pyrophosphohydrolase domain-containing protein [Pseudomonadota bacterium]
MDLRQHLLRQMAFSHATFGPGERREGVADHLRKEICEMLDANGSAREWVDIVILGLDGLTRRLSFETGSGRRDPEITAELACRMIREKQKRNEARTWPDWRTADPDKAIEHDRCGEEPL